MLTKESARFVKAKVSTGRYTSSSEALRLMEKVERQEAEKLAFLREAWTDGVKSDDVEEIDFTSLKQEAQTRLAALKP